MRFGVYLGSVEPENTSSIASWLVAVGVDDLTLVPPQLVVHIGGMMYYLQVYAEAWHRAPIYTSDEMPKHPKVYRRPIPPPPSSTSSEEGTMLDDQELIPMSTQVLREMCRGRSADSLPPELRRFATMEVIEMQNSDMPTTEVATGDPQPDNRPQNKQPIIVPQILHSFPQRSPALNKQPHTFTGVADHHSKHLTTAIDNHNQHSHSKSLPTQPNLPLLTVPAVSDCLNYKNSTAGYSQKAADPLLGGKKRIQPHKILLRGESSATVGNHAIQEQIPGGRPPIQGNNCNNNEGGARITEKNISPKTQEAAVPKIDPKKILPKQKGFPCGPTKGPLATKYKWTKPASKPNPNSSIVIKKGKEVQRPKRKNTVPLIANPPKRATGKDKINEQALISFNPEGFYEVQVQYDHIAKLASGCGFKNSDIEEAITKDNEQRRIQALTNPANSERIFEEDPELEMRRFDPDLEDELTSEEEV